MTITGWYCGPRIYRYDGWTFEDSAASGPWPLTKSGEPRKRAGGRFWQLWDRFALLPKAEQESYRTGGGCQRIDGQIEETICPIP